jgi:hypothetical protein
MVWQFWATETAAKKIITGDGWAWVEVGGDLVIR